MRGWFVLFVFIIKFFYFDVFVIDLLVVDLLEVIAVFDLIILLIFIGFFEEIIIWLVDFKLDLIVILLLFFCLIWILWWMMVLKLFIKM